MIVVLENSLTRKKNTLNLIDHKGKVVGFNPYPNGKRLKYELRDSSGKIILTDETEPIEKYLIKSDFHFGSDITFTVSQNDNTLSAMNLELISDNLEYVNMLRIEGKGGEYYMEDIGIPRQELAALFSKENRNYWNSIVEHNGIELQFLNNVNPWNSMTVEEKLDFLSKKILKIEEKLNLLGNLK